MDEAINKSGRIPACITWGVIGAGDVCEKKSVPAMYKLPDSRVRSVMRRNLTLARDFAGRHHIDYAFNDAEKIFRDPEIDIVYVATPPSSHAEYAIRAAKAGKHAYVEKPMAATYSDCVKMIRAFRKAGKKLFVAYYRRTLPNFLHIKNLILSGKIGKVRYVNILMNKSLNPDIVAGSKDNWRVVPEIAGGGYFYDLASHQLDFLDFVFGPVRQVQGICRNQAGHYQAEDLVTASFAFENEVLGSGTWCFTASPVSGLDMTTIIGEKGKIEYPSFGDPRVILTTEESGRQESEFILPEHIQSLLIEKVNDELRGIGKCPSDGTSGARTNKVMEVIIQSKARVLD